MFGDQNPFLHESNEPKGNPIWGIFQALIVALAINVTIYFLFIIPSQVDGPSMNPTLIDKELLFANKIPTWLGETAFGKQYGQDYERGHIIIFEFENLLLVKRIIGIENDRIRIANGYVYVNDKKISEPYLSPAINTYMPDKDYATMIEGEEVVVPKGMYFVLGDNRIASKDSRYKDIGFVVRDKIKGIVILRFWPMDKFGPISKANYE